MRPCKTCRSLSAWEAYRCAAVTLLTHAGGGLRPGHSLVTLRALEVIEYLF
jgi:hypothetical protein